MSRRSRLSVIDASYLAADVPYLSVGWFQFGPRPDGSVPDAEEIIGHAHGVLLSADAPESVRTCRRRLRRVPGDLGLPYREDDPDFDFRNHFTVHPAATPVPLGGVGRLIVDALARPLDPDRPLWRIEIVESLDDGSFGLLTTYDHAMADGFSGFMAFALMSLGFTPEVVPPAPAADTWRPARPASSLQAVGEALADRAASAADAARRGARAASGDGLRHSVRAASGHVAALAAYLHAEPAPPPRPRDRKDTLASRRACRVHAHRYSLVDLRLASRALGATINELFLAAVGAAWPAVDPDTGGVWVCVPVRLSEAGDTELTNAIGYVVVQVPPGADLLETLRTAQAESARVKRQRQQRALADLVRIRSWLPASGQQTHLGRYDDPDIVLSNLPAVPFQLYCQGGMLRQAMLTSPLAFGWGKLTFCTIADAVYGALIEDSGEGGPGSSFDQAFRSGLDELCRLGEARSLIARQRQFLALGPADLDELTRSATTAKYGEGAVVVSEGDPADALYVVRSGSVRAEGGGAVPVTYRPGESFGEVGVFGGGVRRATVTAEQQSELLRIDASVLHPVFAKDPLNVAPVEAVIEEYDGSNDDVVGAR